MTALHTPIRYPTGFHLTIMSCIKPIKDQLIISNLIYKLNNVNICLGLDTQELSGKLTIHVTTKTENEVFLINPFQSNVLVRSTDCIMLIDKCSTIHEK